MIFDKYYTNDDISEFCLKLLNNKLSLNTMDLIIEPSAGGGAFSNLIFEGPFQRNSKLISIDISPPKQCRKVEINNLNLPSQFKLVNFNKYGYAIHEKGYFYLIGDFLDLELEFTSKKVMFLGNPPFGVNSTLAFRFLKKISSFNKKLKVGSVIGFILPRSFKKESLIQRIDKYWHILYEEDLPINSFYIETNSYKKNRQHENETSTTKFVKVPTTFFIFIKKNEERVLIPSLKDLLRKAKLNGFEFVKNPTEASFAFQRVGSKAGLIKFDVGKVNQSSHYFIKVSPNKIKETIEYLQLERWKTAEYTTGPKSISKREILESYLKLELFSF